MTPDEGSAQSGAEHSAASSTVATRPSGRGRYSRGRRRPRRSTNRPRRLSEASEGGSQAAAEQAEQPARSETREPLSPPFQPAKMESIQAAIDKVTAIIGDLRDVLNDMELVLEYLEDAERQQIADEREIEMLQQRLNSMHRRMDRPSQPSRRAPSRGDDTASQRSEDSPEAGD